MAVILDLDGVIWRGGEAIEGSSDAVDRLRAAGQRLLFVTNNSHPKVEDHVAKLAGMGIEIEPEELITSSMAAATLLEPGTTALVCGGPGVVEALEERGVEPVHEGEADAVVVGFHKEFDFERLCVAFRAIVAGARLVGTNDDPTYPTPDGPIPGGGSLLAAVATAAGVDPVVAGKPHEAMTDMVRDRLGDDLESTVLVGDRPSTDGLMANRLGVPFILVMTGVTHEDADESGVEVDRKMPDLASLVGPDGDLQESA